MRQKFAARVWQEGEWFVSQCLDVEVASQGRTEEEALANLGEALTLYFEPPAGPPARPVRFIEAEEGASMPAWFQR